MEKITLDNLEQFGIGRNFEAKIYPQDIDYIVYGDDTEANLVLENPEKANGTTAFWKEPSYERWWKVGPRGEVNEQ